MSRKSVSILIIVGLALIGTALRAAPVDVTGEWEMTMSGGPGGPGGPGGDRPMVITFVQKGEVLDAKMQGPQGDEIKGTGKIVGNEIEWTFTMSSPDGEMSIVHKGKVDGDTMAGTISMGEMGEAQWTAKRIVKK